MADAMPAVCNRGILEKRRGRVYNGHVQKKKEDERMEKRITPDELADMLMKTGLRAVFGRVCGEWTGRNSVAVPV